MHCIQDRSTRSHHGSRDNAQSGSHARIVSQTQAAAELKAIQQTQARPETNLREDGGVRTQSSEGTDRQRRAQFHEAQHRQSSCHTTLRNQRQRRTKALHGPYASAGAQLCDVQQTHARTKGCSCVHAEARSHAGNAADAQRRSDMRKVESRNCGTDTAEHTDRNA
jgi:hypothetical protein